MAVNNFRASETLKSWIKEHEGFTPVAIMDDWAGTPDKVEMAIGHGHQIQPGEEYLYSATITLEQADALMEKDLKAWEDFINKYITIKLNQDKFDALLNLCYAIGGGGAWPVFELINAKASAEEIKTKWRSLGTYWLGVYRPQLAAMREREIKMYFGSGGNMLLIIAGGLLLITGLFFLGKKI